VCIYGGQLKQMKKTTESVKRQTDILHTQQRAWITSSSECLARIKDFRPPKDPGENECPYGPYKEPSLRGNVDKWGNLLDVTKPNESLRWWVSVGNIGQTPALDVTLEVTWCLSDNLDNDPPEFKVCASQHGKVVKIKRKVVVPLGREHVDTTLQSMSLSAEELDSIRSDKLRLYILERTTYYEWMLEEPHTTEYCLLYKPHWIYPLRACEGGQSAN